MSKSRANSIPLLDVPEAVITGLRRISSRFAPGARSTLRFGTTSLLGSNAGGIVSAMGEDIGPPAAHARARAE